MEPQRKEKILIVGAGNIGMGLALELKKHGHDVFCIARGKSLQDKSYSSIIMQTLDGGTQSQEIVNIPKIVQFNDIQGSSFDKVIITTKIHDSKAALKAIKDNHIDCETIGVIQNGLVPENYFSEHKEVSIISVYEGFHFDKEQGILKRMKNDRGWSVFDQELADFLNSSGIKAIYEDGNQARAIKLLYNSTLNGLSALEDKTLGEILMESELHMIARQLFGECYICIQKACDIVPQDKLWKDLYSLCTGPLSSHYSSTHQDYQAGKPTEIDFLNGFISNLGEQSSIATPLSNYITNCIKGYFTYSRAYLLGLLKNP